MSMFSRRFILGAGGAAVASFALPRMAFARADTPKRFVDWYRDFYRV